VEQEGEEQQQSGAGAAHPGPSALQHCPGSGSGSSRERGGTGVRRGTGSGAAATRLLDSGEGWKGRWQRGGRELRGSGRRVPAAVDGEREVKAGVGGERVRVGELFYASRDQFETFDRLPTNGWDELDHLGQNRLRSISSSA
jgi:hypothetical protein